MAQADPASATPPAEACVAGQAALTLARSLARPQDVARAAAWRCIQLHRLGQHAQVMEEAARALPLMSAPALAEDRLELLRVWSVSASDSGHFDAALDAANEMVRTTTELGEPGPALTAAFALAACFERMGDSWQAKRLLTQALEKHGPSAPDRARLIALNALCAISLGAYHRLWDVGSADEVQALLDSALQVSTQARALLDPVRDPMYEVAVLGNLGEVLMHRGEFGQAHALLSAAQERALSGGFTAHAWRIRASLGAWLLQSGRAAEALADMNALVAVMADAGPRQTFVRAHHVAYRACKELGEAAEALAHFEIVERLERRHAITQLKAQSQLFVTRTEAQRARWQAERAQLDAQLDAQQQRARAAEFAASAERDPLTGLGNRRHLQRRSSELFAAAARESRPLALAHVDVDHFKSINDSLGHAAGDAVLVAMAQLLGHNTRERDVLARTGGEEFVIVLPGTTLDGAADICERLRQSVAVHPWSGLGLHDRPVTISIGLVTAPPYDLATLLKRADEALYRAKHEGRNRICRG
jgi:diguanylate cyclase (GGDEF)-like protein